MNPGQVQIPGMVGGAFIGYPEISFQFFGKGKIIVTEVLVGASHQPGGVSTV